MIYTSKKDEATCYLDKDGGANSKYKIECYSGGKLIDSADCIHQSGKNYIDIKMDKPGNQYSPNDTAVGDVDGDGIYELFVKWDPSNQKDNSQEGKTDNVYIDCYSIVQNKRLWRIDLGKNIRAGSHYTQHLVADFDCDGKAEMMCKTADGTVDGTGKVIGDKNKDYRNGKGYILDGPEYYTLFDGATGKALDTIDYPFPRGKVSDWGDNYGNRVDRFLGVIAYLDGVHPSAVTVRGYYTRMTAAAIDVQNKKLKVRWKFDSNDSANKDAYHNGNHNCMPADVDGDGKQEIVLGATCIDDNGKMLWCTKQGHGDALHLGDLVPERKGLEAFICHEQSPWGLTLLDASNGKIIWHKDGASDTGRCCADNVWAGNPGGEFWGASAGVTYDASGKQIASKRPPQNFLIYWDGDFERELLDGTKVQKMKSATDISTIFTADGCSSNNGTKSVPCLVADIFGDWREELLLRSSDNNYIRIYGTTDTTKVRLTTLMHDTQYRNQANSEQNCYNQPAHASFFLGTGYDLPERPNVTVNGESTGNTTVDPTSTEPPIQTPTVSYKFDLGANAQNGWTSVSASDGYSDSKGYGFSSSSNVSNVAASGSGALSDAVQFTGATTFDVKLTKGLYKIKVTLGNTTRTSVYMENMLQIVNMTGNNAVDEIIIPVTDGKLNIRAAAGKSGYAYTISAVEIDKLSDDTTTPQTVWLCGDSTVCNYYPLTTSNQAGWGQMLGTYLDGWNIRNMAASGQYAAGFVKDRQFDAIEYYGKAGDVYIISMGINDQNYSNATEYYNTITDMTKRAKAKGMKVILVKQQGRKGDYTKNPLLTSRYYSAQLDQISKEQNVDVVDLFNLFQNYCVKVGKSKADSFYIDNVHPNREGASVLAELFVNNANIGSGSGTVILPTTEPTNPVQSDLTDGSIYKIKNVNSGLYLSVEGNSAANQANVQQGGDTEWKLVSQSNGYYSLIAQVGDGKTYALDVHAKKTDDETNIELYTYSGGDNQQFKLEKNADGSYTILTKITNNASCIDVEAKSKDNGANVQQYTFKGSDNQKWIIESVGTDATVKGDINNSGNVDVADLVILQNWILGSGELTNWKVADLCEDGVINVFDMVMLRKILVSK